MRMKIRQLMKRSLVGLAALAMVVAGVSVVGLPVRATEAEPVSVTNFTSHISGEIVLENTGGDNLVLLQPLSAEDEFVFGADVTFTNPDEQQSAALIFGVKDNALDDSHAIKANIHAKIDWNVPARVWGYGTDELRCPGENGQANTFFADNKIDVTQKFRMEVSVQKNSDNQYVLTYSLTNTDGEKVTAAQGILNDSYTGGRFGLMTYSTRAVFSNITLDGQKYGALESAEGRQAIHGVNGDAHIVSDVKLESEQGFTYETDIDLAADTCSAALTFGIQNTENPGEAWIGANFNFNDNNGAGGARVFKVGNGGGDIGSASLEGKLDKSKTIHVKLHVSSTGLVTYELYNTDNTENKVTVTGTISDYQGGYLGLLTFDSSAVFMNTTYTLDEALPDTADYKTNLGELTYAGGSGTWIMTENGLYSDATGMGDCFAFSEIQGTNFVYSTDIDFDGTEGAAALVFRSNRDLNNKECYAVNIDVGSHKCKFWRWQENDALQLIDEKEVPAAADEKYTLKVVAYDSWILYYVNDQLIASTGDYVLQPGNLGQNTVLKEGCFGLLNWNSKVTFQNTYYKELGGDFNPLLTDISVTSSVGTVEEKTQFTSTEPITLQYVKNNASTVNIQTTSMSEYAVVEVKDANGNIYPDGKNIPVSEGSNYITVTSTVTAEEGTSATVVYRVNVHRFKADAVYYNEAYRNQYHYSVKEGWANDPNGLVYFNGTYHFFYQFYDDIVWGPMHWAHATSTDLIHWEEQPIALYPDANGAMFSGCMVIDENNTTGFFDGIPGGGLVALITADGNGQRIKLAYSTDEGKTWTKVDEIAADWTDDPLRDAAFRDPKVFRWEGKWFMVVAGGPLRIYSSEDLRQWKCEATYADLHTECPDLYPIQAPDGQIKWVLSRGGRFYKVGDFKTVDGSWRFVPDADYVSSDGVMNFGRDFYAAMTYYVQDFGTAASPNLPELVELNWMNTWDDYCNLVAEKVGQDFNGTFNLNLKLGLKKDGDKYVLTQTPISGYESLRDTAGKQEWTQVTVEPNSALLKDFVGDTYEIIAKFYPEEGTTKVGFKVRTGEVEETLIVYDMEAQNLSIDRSSSGIYISSKFAEVTSQNVTVNDDGSVDMHIYVDKASVEVFAKDYTAAGSVQIFPSPVSVGAQVLVEGSPAKADITIYPLSTIWAHKAEVTEPQFIGTTLAASQNMYVGDTLKLSAYVLPTSASQEFTWSVEEGSDVAEVDASGTVTALKKGTAVIVAASKANPELTKEFTIQVTENNFKTNISEFVNVNGNWHVDDETLSVSNGGQNDYYMSAEAVEGDFTLETDIRYTQGLINLFLASENLNPHEGVGAYTIQFGYDTNVRLFPFGKDDFTTGTMDSSINDGTYHRVKVIKDGQTLLVYVDDEKCLEHTFKEVEAFFADGHVGIGLWDGALDVQNFFVCPLEDPTDPSEPSEPSESEPVGPVITQQPVDYVGLVGDTASFSVVAEGEDLSYQWYYYETASSAWKKASNGTEATLNVEFKGYRNNQQYRCEITDAEGNTVVTDAVKITAKVIDLVITSQPVSYVGAVNDEVTFAVEATGNGLTYQWYYSEDEGASWYKSGSPGFATSAVSPILRAYRDGNQYRCEITDIFGTTVTSDAASMTVKATEVTITGQPASVENAVLNGLYTFHVAAEGENLTYLWEVSSDNGETWTQSWSQGYNTATLSVRMNANRDGNLYRCVVTSGLKTVVVSNAAILDLQEASAEIVTQPVNVTVVSDATATFTVEATGMDLTYAWYRSNDKGATWTQTYLSGYNTNTLSFTAIANRAAMYMCKITDGSGYSVWSNPVKLQILTGALQILTQPESVTCAAGETAVFTVEAQGDNLRYQWYASSDGGATWSYTFLPGYNTAEFSFAVTAARAAKLYKCVITDSAGNTLETDVVSVTIKTAEPEIPEEPEGGITVAYVPLDDRPVNVDRVIYLAGSAGFEITMPAEADYATVLGTNSHGGSPENLLAWLKDQEAAGVDHYVISLDQMFSGGLCSSRSISQMTTTASGDILEYQIADYLVELSENNYVVFFDTVIRLAPETSYQNFSTEQYHALRSYGSQLRAVLTGDSLTIDNIVAGYRYGQYGETIGKTYTYLDYSDYQYKTATVEESVLSTHLAARERKLRLVDYVIRNVGNAAEHLLIGVDDSSANENIQYNERQYIHKIAAEYGVNYQLFAGADELGMMGIAAMAGDVYGKVNANITYFGGGADMDPADNYDYQSLRTTLNLHLDALGVNVLSAYDSNALQILVLTQDSSTSTYASQLVAQLRSNLDAGIPTCVLDCSNAGANNSRILSDHILGYSWNNSGAYALAETLSISCWNTIGNTIGIGLSNAVGRYAYIYNSEEVTEESNEAFVKTMTFALVKDISYRAHTYGNDTSNANYNMYGRFNFDNSSWDDVTRILEKLNSMNTILGKDGEKVTYGTVSIDENSVDWTWNRDFECSFEIQVAN